MKLYEISAEFRAIADELEELGGEAPPELLARLDAAEGDLEAKVAGIVAIIREKKVEAEAIDAEAKRLKDKANAAKNGAESLSNYLMLHLKAIGITGKIKTPIATVGIQKASRPSIRWTKEGSIPDGYQRIKIELDGERAYKEYREGTLPEGFDVKFSEFLSIR